MSQDPEGITFDEMIEKIIESLSPEGQQDFIRLLSSLDSGTNGENPAAIMKVDEAALRNFINVAVTTIVNIIKTTPGSEITLPPMLLASGMLIGYHAAQAEAPAGVLDDGDECAACEAAGRPYDPDRHDSQNCWANA